MQITHLNIEKGAVLPAPVSAVCKILAYYDIFLYPLTLPEIEKYAEYPFHQLSEVEDAIHFLKEKLIIFQFGDYYTLRNDFNLITRRKMGNKAAFLVLKKANKRARFIHRFPFVRSVNISGSLSKNYFDETTDVDYFVITRPGRLWLCRFILTIYKKIFLFNSRKYFCINYYIDSEHLCIPDKNIFSATEVITLNNQTGAFYYNKFILENDWVQKYYPNYTTELSDAIPDHISGLKLFLEKIFNGKIGDIADNLAQKITKKFVAKKYAHLQKEEFEVNLRTEKTASKHHPQGFQFKVLKQFESTCRAVEEKHSVNLL